MGMQSLLRSDVETEMQHISVLHYIILAFQTKLAGLFHGMLTAQTIDVFKGIRFRADEPFLKISMDDTGTFGRFHALSEGPGTALIFSGRQEGPQIQDAVRSLDDLIQAAFRNAQLLQEFCFLFFIQAAEFLFDLCAYRHNVTF